MAVFIFIGLMTPDVDAADDTVSVGTVLVRPTEGRLFVRAFTGDPMNPNSDPFEFTDANQSLISKLDFVKSHTADKTSSGSFGDHTAHSDGTFEYHVTKLGQGGMLFTLTGTVIANISFTAGQNNGFPSADAVADTGFDFTALPEQQYEWSYECHAKVDDDSDQKDQAHVWIHFVSDLQNQPAIPTNTVLGGLPYPDGQGPSAQLQFDIVTNGQTDRGFGNVFRIDPRLVIEGRHSGKQVKAQMSITFKLKRISGACCDTPVFGCQSTTAQECATFYPNSPFLGLDTDCGSCPASSQEIHWAAAVNGQYATPANWNPQQVPESNGAANPPKHDVAIYDASGSYNVTFFGSGSSERALIRNGAVTWLSAGYQLKSLDTNVPSLAIGANGTLTLLNCLIVSIVHGRVGDLLPGPATLNVFDSSLAATGLLSIGELAPGKMNITGDSLVVSADSRVGELSPGDVIVDGNVNGNPAKWQAGNLAVGFESAGTLMVQGGGLVSANQAFIGFHPASAGSGTDGKVVAKGEGGLAVPSTIEAAHDLIIGKGAHGTLEVQAGGRAKGENVTIGDEPQISGEATVSSKGSLTPSTLSAADILRIGLGGTGNLKVEKGGAAASKETRIADAAGSTGTAVITDADSRLETNYLTVGNAGHGILNVTNTAIVNCGTMHIGELTGGDGAVVVMDGPSTDPALRVQGNLTIGLAGSGQLTANNVIVFVQNGLFISDTGPGTVLLANPGANLIVGGITYLGAAGQLAGTGFLTCANTFVKLGGAISMGVTVTGTVTQVKSIRPNSEQDTIDDPIGTLTIDGNLTLEDGAIVRDDVAGPEGVASDLLHVTGDAVLAGTLEIHFVNGYLPKTGDTFKVVQIDGAATGGFGETSFPDLKSGFSVELTMGEDGVLRAIAQDDAALVVKPGSSQCGAGTCGAGSGSMLMLTVGVLRFASRRARRYARAGA